MSTQFYAGLDLGQSNDYTALAILERIEVPSTEPPRIERIERRPELPYWAQQAEIPQPPLPKIVEDRVIQPEPIVQHHVRWLDRIELGTDYPTIVTQVLRTLDAPELRGHDVTLLIDRTGVGRAVYDLFAEQMERTRASIVPITITAGEKAVREVDGTGGWRVPKRDLVGTIEVLAQARPARLQFVEGLPFAETVKAELRNFQAKITERGHASFEAGNTAGGLWREGAHDDLVLAVALACWYAERYGDQQVTYAPFPLF